MTLREYADAIHKGDDPLAVLRVAVSEAKTEALERAAQVAKQSQEDCFCKDKTDEKLGGMPCAACMEAARIEGTLHGLAHRAIASPAAAPAAEPSERVAPADSDFLTEAELQAAEERCRAADRLAGLFGGDTRSEFGRMVAEIRFRRAALADGGEG